MLCLCATLTEASCICVFVYLYLGNEGVVVGEWIVDVISFQEIFGLCGLNVHKVLESAKHDSQYGNMQRCKKWQAWQAVLVLFFSPAVLIFGLCTRKIC